MVRLIAALVLALLAVPALPAESAALAQIRRQLEAHPRLRADFEQTRHMADAQRPLLAQGRMLVWDQTGVIWQIRRPIEATVVLRDDRTLRIDARGRRIATRPEHDPAAARIGRILRAVLHGDAAMLAQWFDLTAQAGEGGWTVALTPRAGSVGAFLRSMHVRGATFVEHVVVEEANGDRTEIRFQRHEPVEALSELERELLALP